MDVPNLLQNYTTVGFNQFGQHYLVDTLFFYDSYFEHIDTKVYIPQWFPQKGIKYIPRSTTKPYVPAVKEKGMPVFAHRYFTPSVALNWGINNGFKTIYLVGIDHKDNPERFEHHDGWISKTSINLEAHQRFKQYVYACKKHAQIYQTNPAVTDFWDLPFREVSSLYAASHQNQA